MCGMTGFVTSAASPRDKPVLEKMTSAIRRRSPDDSGHFHDDRDRETVRMRLMSRVPLGLLLHGGIDSSVAPRVWHRMTLPRILARKPDWAVAFVGRNPDAHFPISERDRLWHSRGRAAILLGIEISNVPLRAWRRRGLNIYEALAAKIPVASTTIGAEGHCRFGLANRSRSRDGPADLRRDVSNCSTGGKSAGQFLVKLRPRRGIDAP